MAKANPTTPRELYDALERVRAERTALLTEVERLRRRPCPKDEAVQRVTAFLDQVDARVPPFGERAGFFAGEEPPPVDPHMLVGYAENTWHMAMIHLLGRPIIERALLTGLDRLDWTEALSAEERAQERTRLAAAIRDVERKEEHLVRLLEDGDHDVRRRADVNPAVIAAEGL